MDCLNEDFHQLLWSEWVQPRKLVKGGPLPEGVPPEPGVYRIRVAGRPVMAYFGESGDLADRLIETWQDVNQTRGRGREDVVRHLAKKSVGYSISYCTDVGPHPYDLTSKRERECLERCLGWLCRRETGLSPFGNYSRAGIGNQLISDTTKAAHPKEVPAPGLVHPSTRALRPEGREPAHKRWMGLRWSEPCAHRQLTRAGNESPEGFIAGKMDQGPAVYKLLGESGELHMVGSCMHAWQGVRSILSDCPNDFVAAWTPLPRKALKLEAREIIDDILGAYYFETGQMPTYQFKTVYDD
jgi:hypothetical protein